MSEHNAPVKLLDPDENGVTKMAIPEGQKTIVCWNCLSVLMVKEVWNIVECTECHKFNRVPANDLKKEEHTLVLNENFNHFDLNIPYVFGIITCPFCQTENKFRRDADHVVCFRCHHSYSLSQGNYSKNRTSHGTSELPINNQTGSPIQISQKNSLSQSAMPNSIEIGRDKSMRFSDFYSPDIMQFRGMYPQPYYIMNCDCTGTSLVLNKLLKVIKRQNMRPRYIPPPNIDRYAPWRQLVRDIDDIDDRRGGNNKGYSNFEGYKKRMNYEIYGNGNNGGQLNTNKSTQDYNGIKSDAIYKMMFNHNARNHGKTLLTGYSINNRYGDDLGYY